MKMYSLDSFDGGLVVSKHNTYAFSFITFNNGIKTVAKTAEGAKLVIVLSGEMDMLVEGKPFRLKKGYWLNIPKDKEYVAHVYRSLEECKFVILTCLQGAIDTRVNVGELSELPLKAKDMVKYAIFGHESEIMQGHIIEFNDKDATWTCNSNNEAFLFTLEGEVTAKALFSKMDVPEGHIAFLPKKRNLTLTSKGKAKVIAVTSPASLVEVREYIDWLKKEYGYVWDNSGIIV